MLYQKRVIVSLAILKDTIAAAGTALLLGAAAMSSQQDPAAASAPLNPRANANAVEIPAQVNGSDVQEEPREIRIVAKRFAFEPARIEVAVGERVRLVVASADGVHGIEIKKFKVNTKVPRGGEAVIELVATAAGEFPILCSEYCGDDHENMKGTLVVAAKSAR